MLKLAYPNSFHNIKCGEIFCISPTVFNVTCLLCSQKMHLEIFAVHFQLQHLTMAEESINLDELVMKGKAKLEKDATLVDNMTIKEEDPEDDPIKQEDFPGRTTDVEGNNSKADENEDEDEDDKCLQQLINETGRSKKEVVGEVGSVIEIVPRKPFTRNDKKSSLEDTEEEDKTNILQIKKNNETKDSETLINLRKEEMQIDDGDEDNEWSDNVDDKDTDSDSETDIISKDELPYPCLICKRSYRTKHSLQKHNHSVHNPNKPEKKPRQPKHQHKCDECNEVFRSARDLRGHKWKHTGIFCDICGKPFTQTGNMMRHKIRHTGIKAHKCKECSKEFFTDKELKSHMICHTGVMPVICEICGKRCRDRGVLTAHMRRHTGERPAKCNVCDKSFFSFHDLNVHAVTHSSERPFKCDICGSTFQRKKALRVHKLIHSKDRKHICKICGKCFAQSGGLNSHMRTHDAAVVKSNTEPSSVIPTSSVGQLTSSARSMVTEFVVSAVEEDPVLPEYVV